MKDREINVPYGFYLKGSKISFFNRDYMPLGIDRETATGTTRYKRLPWSDYLKLFHFNAASVGLKKQYMSFSVYETTYNYIRVFYLYDDTHA